MHKQNISSFKALSKVAGVSEYQIQRLRKGEIQQMRLEFLVKLSQALQIDLNELINDFSETILIKQSIVRPRWKAEHGQRQVDGQFVNTSRGEYDEKSRQTYIFIICVYTDTVVKLVK